MGKNSWNEFKNKVNAMTTEEKEELLQDLHKDYMEYRTRKFHDPDVARIRFTRKKIAYLKTVLNVKGFHYHPRD